MRRLALAFVVIGAVIAFAAAPTWAATAGQFCKDSEAGITATAGNGRTVICQFNPNSNRNQWTYTTSAAAPTAAPTTGAVAASPSVAAATTAKTGLASTGLSHTPQAIELAVILLGLGTALVIARRPGVIPSSHTPSHKQTMERDSWRPPKT